jgi:hypothetical protein
LAVIHQLRVAPERLQGVECGHRTDPLTLRHLLRSIGAVKYDDLDGRPG